MLKKTILAVLVATSLISCNSETKDKNESGTGKPTESGTAKPAAADDGFVIPKIDTSALKTVEDIVKAHAAIVDARLADEKLQKDNPNARSHYVELMTVFNDVNERRTTFGKQFEAQAYLDYDAKFKAAEDRMYGRTAGK